MTQKAETAIVQSIIAYIKASGGDAWHVHGSAEQRGGEPDIDGWIPDYFYPERPTYHLKIEVKVPGGTLSPRQLIRLNSYFRAGYVVGVVTSKEEFIDLLNGYGAYRRQDPPEEWHVYHFIRLANKQLAERYSEIYDDEDYGSTVGSSNNNSGLRSEEP